MDRELAKNLFKSLESEGVKFKCNLKGVKIEQMRGCFGDCEEIEGGMTIHADETEHSPQFGGKSYSPKISYKVISKFQDENNESLEGKQAA